MPPTPERTESNLIEHSGPRNSITHQAKKPLRVEECLQIQAKQYFEHPVWKAVSILMLTLVVMSPYLLYQRYGDWWMGRFEEKMWAIFTLIFAMNLIVPGILNFMCMKIYKANNPFFEQFKSNDQPWPWVTEPEEFKKKLMKALKVVSLNIFVYGIPFFYAAAAYYPFKTSASELPSL